MLCFATWAWVDWKDKLVGGLLDGLDTDTLGGR